MLIGLFSGLLQAADHPNILWIVSEDNSSHWMGCYGNKQARTPRIDALAKEGVLFEHAYSNAPVCAVARATILNGAWSPTMGTQHMRSRHPIPAKYRPNVEYLRKAGYFCTNNAKTDYNFKGSDTAIWDESSKKAYYLHRPEGAPFFAIFNLGMTHESSLFANKEAEPLRLNPEEIELPPYVPDLPEMRKDFARYHDRITEMDADVGRLLDELEARGLADDTIVIYTSDHGGVTPRGKRYLYETGVKIPCIIRVPEKWRNLCKFSPGQRVTEPVSFVDFAPTLLSLAGIDTPPQMQGRPFLGGKRVEPAADEMEFLYADRFDDTYGMRRGLTDGKWKYVRQFTPRLAAAPYSFYPFGLPSWKAWERASKDGKLTGIHQKIWDKDQAPEELYDLGADPWEIRNLAADPAHAEKLKALRQRLKDTMKKATDTGLIPEPLFETLAGDATIAEFAGSDRFDFDKALDLAFIATQRDAADLPLLEQSLASKSPVERYWAVSGLWILGDKASEKTGTLPPLLADEHSVVRTITAETLWNLGKRDQAKNALLDEVGKDLDASSLLYLLNTLRRLDLLDELPEGWQKTKARKQGTADYVNRFTKSTGSPQEE
ncbi:sulfatase [Luteolibacter yonseiensis]